MRWYQQIGHRPKPQQSSKWSMYCETPYGTSTASESMPMNVTTVSRPQPGAQASTKVTSRFRSRDKECPEGRTPSNSKCAHSNTKNPPFLKPANRPEAMEKTLTLGNTDIERISIDSNETRAKFVLWFGLGLFLWFAAMLGLQAWGWLKFGVWQEVPLG